MTIIQSYTNTEIRTVSHPFTTKNLHKTPFIYFEKHAMSILNSAPSNVFEKKLFLDLLRTYFKLAPNESESEKNFYAPFEYQLVLLLI